MSSESSRFQMANRIINLLFFLSALVAGAYMLSTQGIGVAWKAFAGILYLLIPPLYRRIFRLRPSYLIDMTLLVFILLAYNLGVALGLYGVISWYDNAVHGLSGAVFALIGLCVYAFLDRHSRRDLKHARGAAVGFSFCFAQMTAVVWELIEYAGFLLFGHDAQDMANGAKDSMEDMFFCLICSMFMCVLMAIHLGGKHKMFLFAPADEFCRVNFGSRKPKETTAADTGVNH